MRKFTGKAVSLVLALALTVSSFSGTFAFAATKSEKATKVEFGNRDNDEVTLVKDSTNPNVKFNLYDYIEGLEITPTDKYDHNVKVEAEDITVKHSSGKSLVSITKDNESDETLLRVKKDETGTEKLMVYGEVTITRDDDKEYTVKASKEFTVNVVALDERFVALSDDAPDANDTIPDLEINANDYEEHSVAVYQALPGADLVAQYSVATTDDDGKAIRIEATSSRKLAVDDEKNVTKIQNLGEGTATLKLSIKADTKGDEKYTKTVDTTTATILKKVDLSDAGKSVTIKKVSGKTRIDGNSDALNIAGVKDSWNLNGYDFVGNKDNTEITFQDGVSVGNIKKFKNVTVEDKAKTGNIKSVSNQVLVKDEGTVVGTVDLDDTKKSTDYTTAGFEMREGRAANVIAHNGEVVINGGTVTGDVTIDDVNEASGTISIDSSDDEVNTQINGTVTAKTITVEATSDDASTKIGKLVLGDGGVATISDTNVTIDSLDADYEGNVDFKDFHGTISALLNPQDITADEDTDAVIKGDVNAESLDIDEEGILEFTGALDVDSISGSGKLVIGADKLMINEDASSGLILKLAGNNVNVGDVAFKAAADVADVDTFEGVGFTTEKNTESKSVDKFLVKNVEFAGVALDKTAVEVAKDYTATVTVSNYPASSALPVGAKVEWDYSDADKDVFEVTENGATVTVKAVGFDSKYATSNTFDLIATVVDADGDVLEDYESAKAVVTAIAEPKFTSDLSGIVEVPQGSVKNFNLASSDLITPSVGNSAVAVTGTVAAYANGKATYAVKAVGAVGTTTGVYANVGAFSKQIFTVKVTAPKVTVDTTVDFALAKGNRYVYKVTAPAAPSFTVGNGAVIKTQAGKVAGNDYYFSVYAVGTAGQSTGVYVNGVKVNTITVK